MNAPDHEKFLALAKASRRDHLRHMGAAVAGIGVSAATVSSAGAWPGGKPPVSSEATPTPGGPAGGAEGGMPPFSFRLEASEPQVVAAGLNRFATLAEMPVLQDIAFVRETINPGAAREIHWHMTQNELTTVLSGTGRVYLLNTAGEYTEFDAAEGDIIFVPNGAAHSFANTGDTALELLLAFSDTNAASIDLSISLPLFPQQIITQPVGVPMDALPTLPIQGDGFTVPVPEWTGETKPSTLPAADPARYFTTAAAIPEKQFPGGKAWALSRDQIPTLDTLTVYRLLMDANSLREPHWHPGINELNYCLSGRSQFGLISPDGQVQTFVVEPGDVAFMPANWLHYIMPLDGEPSELLVHFTDIVGTHLELSEIYDAFPPQLLSASFGLDPAPFAALPHKGDVFLAGPVEE